MSFDERKKAALEELKKSGIMRANYMPPIFVLLWKYGHQVRPPHYNHFLHNALFTGLFMAVLFAPCWFILMGLLQGHLFMLPSLPLLLAMSLVTGVFFGISMAYYYRWSARKHGLSEWQNLSDAAH